MSTGLGKLTRVLDTGERGGVRAYLEEASRQLWADTSLGVIEL
jgi:hypothetical protein